MKKFLLSGLTILMSTLVWAVAGEEVAGQVSVPAPRLSDVASESSRVSLFSSGGTSTYRYAAKGGLSTSASGDDITLYFDVSDCFAEIKSARIELMSYDVDYPEATEADITYLNGVDLNQWLKGENGDWEKNTIQITNLSILKTPAVTGGTVRNTFYVDVNAHNEGWITCISEAILIIEGITFTVTASDGSDAEGVHVQWTPLSNATFTLWRGEKPREKTKQLGEGVFTTTEFLDTEVSSGKVYYYTVEASFSSGVDTISGTNDGYADSDIAPKLLHLKLPSFWLENKAPLVWVWNDFNNKKYKVTKFEYEILKINRKGSLKKENDEIKPFDVGTENLADGEGFNFTDNDFGKHSVNFSWTYQNSKGEKKTLSETREITIYFNKYDNNNWYNYWPKMGAIAKGLIGDNPKFKLGVGASGVHGSVKPKNIFADPVECDSYPRILSNIKKEKISYMCSITNLAPTASKLVHESNKEVKGIEALAATLAHELEHVRLYQEYYGAEVLIGDLEVNSGFTKLEDIRNDLNKKFENGKPKSEYSSVTNLSKYKNKIDELANNSWKGVVCDLDGDVVLDHTEGGSSLTVGNPDTKEMVKIDSSYATYGDNEYLARKAEENRGKYFDKEKDWAFPGSKCCPEGSGMSKGVWDASGQKKNMLNSLEPEIFAKDILDLTQPVVLSSVSARLMSSSEEEKGEMGGALDVLPSLFEIEESELSLEGDLGDQTLDYATAEGYTVLATSFTIVNEGEALEAAEVTGYLVDTEGNPVAFAQTTCNLPIGNTMVTLEFPGTSLCRIKSDSYRLALLQVIKTSGDLSEIVFSKTQFENDIFSYNNTQFKGAKANFLYNTFSETKSQEALTVEVNGYVAVPGVYRIEARLEGADGDLVSHVGYEQEFTAGEMTASFVFPNEEIYLSRQNGPYDICFVRISQDGVVLDERRMPYQTSTYSYTDFTPEHVCLVIDESSFKRGDDVVGTDGLITNLSFSFDVDYQGEETTQCQGRLSIYGANDTIVAVSQENFSLVKGRNTLDFLVDGYSIQRSGVNGPYYVKDVLLRPQNGAAECFEPKMTPIELNADDFGAYPFVVTDKVVARENNGNYDLIVPIEIDRAHTLTLYAMLVDAKEQCVATATTSKTYSAPCDDELILTFTATDIAASGRRGPYKVRLIQATTDIPNIEMVSIPVPICTPTYEVVNGEVTITGCILPFGILEIPDVIEGCPVTTIAAAAFKGWSNLTSVTIPSSVTTIGYDAFSGVAPTTLTAAYFPNCGMSRDNLKTLIISEGVTSIKSSAFADCSSLTSVTIPSSVTSIRYGAFADCSSLTSVHISDLAAWCGIDFDSAHGNPLYYAKKLYLNGELITDLVIPFGVTSIGNDAFYNCSSLTSVTIPSSVTSIGDSAFRDCLSLTSVTIPEGVTSIGHRAFSECSSLTSVTIPEGVTIATSSGVEISNGTWSAIDVSNINCSHGYQSPRIGHSSSTSMSVKVVGPTVFSFKWKVSSKRSSDYLRWYLDGTPKSRISGTDGDWQAVSCSIPEGEHTIQWAYSKDGSGTSGSDCGWVAFNWAAFAGCANITEVTLPCTTTPLAELFPNAYATLERVTLTGESETIAENLFSGCASLQAVEIPHGVTSIKGNAFSGCLSLTSVTIPSSVTSIGSFAFRGCSGLTSVTIPSSVTSIGYQAFSGCSNLYKDTNGVQYESAAKVVLIDVPTSMTGNFVIPNSVRFIHSSAFYDCSGLTSVTIPSSVTTIGYQAFAYCSRLKTVTFEGEPPVVESSAFSSVASGRVGRYPSTKATEWEAVITDGKWNGLTMVCLEENPDEPSNPSTPEPNFFTYEIKDNAVTITGLQGTYPSAISIPATLGGYPVTTIGDSAFYNCSSLTSVAIPSSVTSIGHQAFFGCSSLTSVTIPSSVTSIGYEAFRDCSNLWKDENGVQYESAAKVVLIDVPTSMTGDFVIPNSVRFIHSSAFYGCSSLTSVTIPEGVTSIRYAAFWGCSSLTSVTIPSSVTSIGDFAFYDCSSLTSVHTSNLAAWCAIDFGDAQANPLYYAKKLYLNGELITDLVIPFGVTSIGDYAFRDCLSLTSVTIPSIVTTIGYQAFAYCSSLTSVTIPEGVTSIESAAFYNCSSLTSVTIPSSVTTIGYSAFYGCSGLTSVTISEGLTSIGDGAFYGCSSLTSVTIPSSVTTIKDSAFSGCLRLTSVTIPEGVTTIGYSTFRGCSGLTSVTIPKGVTSIGNYAFYYCESLTSVTIPESVTSIGEGAFSRCSSLTSVTIPSSVTSIGDTAFSACSSLTSVTIPEGVTTIGASTFYGCSRLTSVTIPSSVTTIGDYAFSDCSSLSSVTIPSSVTSIGEYAFSDCSGLTSVTIPSSVTSIGDSAFRDCSSLTSVTIPESVTEIGNNAFYGVAPTTLTAAYLPGGMSKNNLKTVIVPEGVTSIEESAFRGCSRLTSFVVDSANQYYSAINGLLCSKDGKTLVACPGGLTSVTIPEGVTSIGNDAFRGCSRLVSVTIPSSVTSIGSHAFSGCSGLTSVTIPSSVTSIGNDAFSGCSGLTSVTIPSSVTSIGIQAFVSCSGLTSVTIPSSVTSIGYMAFYNCSSLTSVTIPEGVTSIGDYAFSYCSSLASVTIPESVTSIGDSAFNGVAPETLTAAYFPNCGMSRDNLKTLIIPEGVTSIKSSAFSWCSGLTSVTIPEGVTSIGHQAFYQCSSLTSVTIPSSVTSIGDEVFYRCESLTSVHISNLAAWCAIDFGDAQANPLYYAKKLYLNGELITDLVIPFGVTSIGDYAFSECSSLTSVTIPEGVTSIGDRAFGWCSGLTSVTIPEGVTSIRDGAFCGCSGLTSVTIPEGVTSIWDFAFKGCSGLTSVTIPSSVTSIGNDAFSGCSGLTSVTIPEGVTSIGDWVFSGCSGLTSVTIPEGVTSIGDWVFNNCSKLPKDENGVQYESAAKVVLIDVLTSLRGEFVIPNSVRFIHSRAFEGCSSLTSVTIPEGVTSIGDYTFKGCSGLTSVTIPEGVTSIGSSAFRECSGLTSVTIPSSVTSIGSYAFYGCSSLTSVTIPSSVTSIGERAFYWCESLTSVTIPEGVTSIRYAAFWGCSSLTSVTIPEGVTSIGDGAFSGCSGLTSVTIPSSVTSIVDSAFYGCSGLTSVTISEGLTSIGDGAFSGCSSLTSVTIPSSVTSIGDSAFYCCKSLTTFVVDSTNQHYSVMNGLLCSKDGKTLVVCPGGLTSVTIPSSVTTIGDYAFARCSSLTSVTIPEGVISIGSSAFYGCSSLTSVTIPSSVTSIGDSAFYGCSGLTSVTIPSSVTFIGDEAFLFCLSLTSVHISDLAAWCKIAFKGSFSNPLYFAKKLYLNGELITNLVIPSSVTSIEHFAFRGCSGLTSVTIPEGVTSIGDEAFYRCESLTSVTIPSSVTTIKDSAFENCSSLTSVDFKGEPPSVGFYAFLYISSSATGSYLPQYASEWEAVITGGKWNGLKMVQKEMATLPEGLPDAIGEWLTDVLEASGITSGSAVLAEGTTVEALGAARLLGITPSVSVSGNIATVAAESTFEVSKVVVAENAVSLAVTITVEAGRFPSEVSLGGAVKLMVCDTLNGEWTEVTPAPSQIMLTRISDTEATLSVTQTLDAYQFFKVLVK